MKIADNRTRELVTADKNTTLRQAATLMRERHVGTLVVVANDAEGSLRRHRDRSRRRRRSGGAPARCGQDAARAHHDEDFQVALRDAFDAAGRRIEDYARISRATDPLLLA